MSNLRTSGIASWCQQPWWLCAPLNAQSCSRASTHPLRWCRRSGHPCSRGQVHRHMLMSFLKELVVLGVAVVVSADDRGPLCLHLGHHTGQNPPLDRDIARKGVSLVPLVSSRCSQWPPWTSWSPNRCFCRITGASPCQFLQAGPTSYFERWFTAFGWRAQPTCLPSSWPPENAWG